MSGAFHRFWLKITALIVGSFGPVFFLGAMVPTSGLARLTLDLLGWRLTHPSDYLARDTRFLSALTGGFLLGWGVMIWSLSSWVYPMAPDPVRRAVLASLLAWFCLDSAGSIASGSPSNALFNIVFLLLAVGPLWRPARDSARVNQDEQTEPTVIA
jgi:hypothetical protein